jgi:hypothetical protein
MSIVANLTPASGRQNHTTSPYAESVLVRRDRSTAPDAIHIHRIPRPTCRDDRETPLSIGARDARISKSVLPDGETEKFFREGLDFLDFAEKRMLFCPSGKSPRRFIKAKRV